MRIMKDRTAKKQTPESPRVVAVKRILSITKLVRQRGSPEEAEEAVEWEKLLMGRIQELEKQTFSQAA